MKRVKALIITGYGINCEEEIAAAYKLADAEAEIVHLNDIFLGKCSIHDYDVLNFPGGFSFGDDLGSGKVLSNKMKFKKLKSGKLFFDDIKDFLNEGKFILGVCNGFQFLVKMGLLPNVNSDFEQEVTLTGNNSGKFEDRWVYIKANKNSKTPFLKGIEKIYLPVRHGEGKLIIKNEKIKAEIIENNLNCLTYCDEDGNETSEYPQNPNGSDLNCAGLTNESGQIFGMMPHPEAFLSLYNHPNWPQIKRQNPGISEDGEGLKIFKNIVEYILNEKKERIERFIGIFNKHLDFIEKTTFPQYNQLYKKMICVTIIDTLATTIYPKKRVGDRFCDLLSNFTDYDFWNKVSPLMLYKILKKNHNNEILSIFNSWNTFPDVRIGLIDDLPKSTIKSIKPKDLEKFTHKMIFYKYRCSMIHEFQRPDGGSNYDTINDKLPLYQKMQIHKSKDISINLVYPLGFFIQLCKKLLGNVYQHYIENNINPFRFFKYDDLEIKLKYKEDK